MVERVGIVPGHAATRSSGEVPRQRRRDHAEGRTLSGDRPGLTRPTVIAVGLGPAGSELMTGAAISAFAKATRSFVRTARHPAAAGIVAAGATPLDEQYESAERFEDAYGAIVEILVAAAIEFGSVTYGVPGSPLVAESTVERLRVDPRIDLVVIPGMSFLELCWERLGVDPMAARVRVVDAARFDSDAAGDTGPLLVAQAWSRALLSDVKLAPENQPPSATLLHHLGLADEVVVTVPWEDLDRTLEPDHLTSIWIPELAEPVAFELARVAAIVRTLRVECPWDATQTHTSLTRHLLEETYEAIEAIDGLGDGSDPAAVDLLEEELGDVLCQVLFHATIAAESGLFNLSDVASRLSDKLVHRHPHVFAESDAPAAEDVLARWEQQKVEEKGRDGLLEGIPAALPALALGAKYERRSKTAGLGATETGLSFPQLREAVAQVAGGDGEMVGTLLFELARLAADLGVDPEDAARRAAGRFRQQFEEMERSAKAVGVELEDLDASERIARFRATRASD
ncbi:MAG TPA: MazG family protein [Acidimicrobiales bacterium]|nr:MazG family protein [Acidimicrobiales bacterium]